MVTRHDVCMFFCVEMHHEWHFTTTSSNCARLLRVKLLSRVDGLERCTAANVRQGLSRGQFHVHTCRVPFLQIPRNQLPPQAGCEIVRPLLSSTAAGLPSS